MKERENVYEGEKISTQERLPRAYLSCRLRITMEEKRISPSVPSYSSLYFCHFFFEETKNHSVELSSFLSLWLTNTWRETTTGLPWCWPKEKVPFICVSFPPSQTGKKREDWTKETLNEVLFLWYLLSCIPSLILCHFPLFLSFYFLFLPPSVFFPFAVFLNICLTRTPGGEWPERLSSPSLQNRSEREREKSILFGCSTQVSLRTENNERPFSPDKEYIREGE